MNRRSILTIAGLSVFGITLNKLLGVTMNEKLTTGSAAERMPVLFIGHGSPMNAIETNDYTETVTRLGANLPRPKAILVISAHWMTRGSWVTEMANPKTIHDFGGFPQELFDVQYPAPGSPDTAKLIRASITEPQINGDLNQWGLDHGTWSVLKHLYPAADIPVVQLSLDMTQPPEYHFKLGQKIAQLRDQGVLILGSGNLVHNLRQISWESNAKPFDWAVEFDQWFKDKIIARDFNAIVNDFNKTSAGKLSVPTPDHYYPIHYILGAASEKDELKFEYEKFQNGSISMRSFRFG